MCSHTPRFSYGFPETTVQHVWRVLQVAVSGSVRYRWVGRQGSTHPPSRLLEEVPTPAKRAPEARHGLEWVGVGAGRPGEYGDGGWAGSCTHPCGARSVTLQVPSLVQDPLVSRLSANKGEIPRHFSKT